MAARVAFRARNAAPAPFCVSMTATPSELNGLCARPERRVLPARGNAGTKGRDIRVGSGAGSY